MHLLYSSVLLVLSLIAQSVQAGKTSIYIDKVPAYSSLAQCAQDRVSAIVRAQASGCGDDMALTSFSCFCIDSSSYFNSVLSTDVAASCQAAATTTRAGRISQTLVDRQATALPDVGSVLDVFHSYCLKTTELAQYNDDATATVTITQGPLTTTAHPAHTSTSTSSPTSAPSTDDKKKTPVAAIAVPIVIGVLAIAGGIAIFFWLRRRRATKQDKASPYTMPAIFGGELHGIDVTLAEAASSGSMKYHYELESREVSEPVEMDGASAEGKAGWRKVQA